MAASSLTDNEALELIGPDNQKNYGVKNGRLVTLD
jgi:hypothetical protein